MWTPRRLFVSTVVMGLALLSATPVAAQGTSRTLVAVFAHPDDETSAAPVLARYAREGVRVYLIIATDGAAGGNYTSIPRGPELARARAEEAACAAIALGVKPPILLGFPDAQLGNYAEDPTRLYRLTQRIQEELQRLRPDALITWGPDGGTGHPGSSAGEQHRDPTGSRRGHWCTGAPLLFGDSGRGNPRHESGARRAAIPGTASEVLHDARAVHTRRWRRRRALDGLSQDAVLG
jgi:GlcNAc-PI de-N-acetylase